jgi:hypothetical protein
MVEAVPSKLALATVADWTRDPGAYDPVVSYEHGRPRDVRELGVDAATGRALLEPFV